MYGLWVVVWLESTPYFVSNSSRYDSDNPRVHGDVGMAGVAIDSIEDMKVVYVPLYQPTVLYWHNSSTSFVMTT